MAGLRIGYLVAKPEIANKIRKNVVAMVMYLLLKQQKKPKR